MKNVFVMLLISISAFAADKPPEVRYHLWHLIEGYRLGFVSNFGEENWTHLWTYEGQINLGTATQEGPIYDRPCMEEYQREANSTRDAKRRSDVLELGKEHCFLTEEPWPFSATDSSTFEKWSGLQVRPVLIYYERPVWTPYQYFTDTKDYVLSIFPVEPNLKIEKKKSLSGSLFLGSVTNRARKTIQGRIVKATLEHPVRKTFEVIVEEGLTGNSFIAMSVDESDMFDYIVRAMLTGKVLKIDYVRFYDWEGFVPSAIFSYNTYYRIVSVEVTDVDYPLPFPPTAEAQPK